MSNIKSGVQLALALQAYAQKDLQKVSVATRDVDTLLTKAGLRAGSFDLRFPSLFSFHGIDIKNTLKDAVAEKEISPIAADYAIQGMYNAISTLSNKFPILTEDKWTEIESKIEAFINTVVEGSQIVGTLSDSTLSLMRSRYEDLKSSFSKAMLVSYIEQGEGREPSIKIVHNSFSNFRDTINKAIKAEVLKVLKDNNVTNSKLSDPNFLTTKILNWGHTRTGESIMSGKLVSSLISLKGLNPSNEVMEIISKDFIKETGQINTEIKLHRGDLTKGDKNVLSLVIDSKYLQKVAVQYVPYNQSVLSQQEIRWNLVDAIKRNPELKKMLGISDVSELPDLLLNIKSSPSTVDSSLEVIRATLEGTKPKSTKLDKTLLKFTQPIKLKSKKLKVKLKNGVGDTPRPKSQHISGSDLSLTSLQSLINRHLQDVISANMGDGSSTNVLNYRTGRLASSAKIERISESREGMITAFYSYMKNPYATFSEGGQQQFPRSRDPKLLISKSIREIAAEKVGNRLRAVVV